MADIKVRDLRSDLSWGSIVDGVTYETLADPAIRGQLNEIFEDRGMVVFENIEPSQKMMVELSNVFGPLKHHPVKAVARVDEETMPGVIDMHTMPQDPCHDLSGLIAQNNKIVARHAPWHFDHAYNDELNRTGVLRCVINAPEGEGGRTGFADGIQLYKDFNPELREKIEHLNAIYTLDVRLSKQPYGRNFIPFGDVEATRINAQEARIFPRAIHPFVWTRKDGQKVLHAGPWMFVGIEGHEDAEGAQLCEEVMQEINRLCDAKSYFHNWKETDMVIWDNWRILHAVEGCNPMYERQTQRTTVVGDYGLGRFEGGKKIGEVMREVAI
jgi:taurine dioxygenase